MSRRHLILDLSRMLSRARYPVPTGIDRVELAYAEGLMARAGDRLEFGAMHPLGQFALLSRNRARRFLEATAQRWRGRWLGSDDAEPDAAEPSAARVPSLARRLQNSILLRSPLPSPSRLLRRNGGPRAAYLLVSHHHLDRPAAIEGIKERNGAVFVPLLHDLIPIEYPEYSRPGESARHQRRVETLAQLSEAVVVQSEATRRSLQPWLDRVGRSPPVLVAPLGVDPAPVEAAAPAAVEEPPFFVALGTIEARKNHLLLLQIWRRLAERLGPAAPRLVLIGRRGWENEQVLDLLERCPSLHGLVEEHGNLSDLDSIALMRRARALLTPTFAEGYGLPLVEALAAGVPALCSDIPAHREVGGPVPEYLDPLDGLGWLEAVLDYLHPASPRRAAQLGRLAGWRPPSWDTHLTDVLDFVDNGIA